jgi:hypothetical protein
VSALPLARVVAAYTEVKQTRSRKKKAAALGALFAGLNANDLDRIPRLPAKTKANIAAATGL